MKVSKKRKRRVATLLLAASLLPAMAMAQGGGLFGLGDMSKTDGDGAMNRGAMGGYNLSNQQFGSDANGGYELSNQTFGQDAPAGSGLAILMMAGAGYAAMKSRKKNQKSNK